MLTETELRWIRHAMTVDQSKMQAAKTYRIIGQLFEGAARRLEVELMDQVDAKLERNYQDQQNQKLVDILSQ